MNFVASCKNPMLQLGQVYLLGLDRFRPVINKQESRLKAIVTPLVLQEWENMLEGYPEQRIANYLLFGIREDFRVGFNRSSPLRSAKSNMKAAAEHPRGSLSVFE